MNLTGYAAELIGYIQFLFLLIVDHHWGAAISHWPAHSPMRHHLWLLKQQVEWIMESLTGIHIVG